MRSPLYLFEHGSYSFDDHIDRRSFYQLSFVIVQKPRLWNSGADISFSIDDRGYCFGQVLVVFIDDTLLSNHV